MYDILVHSLFYSPVDYNYRETSVFVRPYISHIFSATKCFDFYYLLL